MKLKCRRRKHITAGITAQQLANKLRLSQSTISRAFTESASIHPETKALVLNAASSMGYQPNIIARSLITRRTNIVAVVVANLTDPFHPLVIEQLAHKIQSSGRQLLLFLIPPGKHVDDALPSLLQYKVDAILITSATVSSRMASSCAAQGSPVVLFNRYVPGARVPAICCDNVAGGRAAADYLSASGHVRPAFVAAEVDTTTNRDRAQGFFGRLEELGLSLHAHEIGGQFSYTAGYEAARRLVQRRRLPDSIFFASDILAIGGIDAIRAANLRVPDDISVVGYDDVPVAGLASYELTTIRQPIPQMVDVTVKVLGLDSPKIRKPRNKIHFLEGVMIERNTVRKRLRPLGSAMTK